MKQLKNFESRMIEGVELLYPHSQIGGCDMSL